VPAPSRAAIAEDTLLQARRYLSSGLDAAKRGDLARAAIELEQAIEHSHEFAAAHHALGQVRLREERFEDAADSLELAVLFDPTMAQAHADLAIARAHLGAIDAAREAASAALALDEKSCEVEITCARAYKVLDDLDSASRCYERALRLSPGCADYEGQLGYLKFLRGEYDVARRAYEHVLSRHPAHAATLHNLGLLELEVGHPNAALAHFERAAREASLPETQTCIGHALRDLGRIDDACAAYGRVLADRPEFSDARTNLAYALLMREDFASGWAHYESRFHKTRLRARDFGVRQWQGEPLADRRVLIYAEQGIGDEIMFASCIPDVFARGGQCVIECNTRLASLFARSFPTAYVHGGEKGDDPRWLSGIPRCDYQVSIGSLPRHFRNDRTSFEGRSSYLVADPVRTRHWREAIGGGDEFKVGFAWRGGTLRSRQAQRSIALDEWASLFDTPNCSFVALQHGDHRAELRSVTAANAVSIHDRCDICADIDELASLVQALDLVITVDNTLAHLAGALGRPVWVLLPSAPEWRYPRAGSEMPWYRSMSLFRRKAGRPWGDVIGEVAARLTRIAGRA
jgi:tetratricopeptide (TPR) repeat protein